MPEMCPFCLLHLEGMEDMHMPLAETSTIGGVRSCEWCAEYAGYGGPGFIQWTVRQLYAGLLASLLCQCATIEETRHA
jgi:hypothetical protein